MMSVLIYNRETNILTICTRDGSYCKDYPLKKIPSTLTSIEFYPEAIEKYDYHLIFGSVLENTDLFNTIHHHIVQSNLDHELFESVLIDEATDSRIYITEGKVWDWNFEFVIM